MRKRELEKDNISKPHHGLELSIDSVAFCDSVYSTLLFLSAFIIEVTNITMQSGLIIFWDSWFKSKDGYIATF